MPKELGDLINLTVFDVSNNSIGGKLYVPAYMRVVCADIPICFAGELPKELGNLVKLTVLWLYNNKFRGQLYVPSYMCKLYMASKFGLSAGAIPVELGQLVNLKYLWLQDNRLTGDFMSQHT